MLFNYNRRKPPETKMHPTVMFSFTLTSVLVIVSNSDKYWILVDFSLNLVLVQFSSWAKMEKKKIVKNSICLALHGKNP